MQSVVFDRGKGPGRRYSDVLSVLASLGLHSAWHSYHREARGAETAATLFWRWKADKPFHIDYAFMSESDRWSIIDASLGSFNKYVAGGLSDHVPLTIELQMQNGTAPIMR